MRDEDKSCKGCQSYHPTAVFELCLREESRYSIAGKEDFHTCGHMLTYNCGSERRLFRLKRD